MAPPTAAYMASIFRNIVSKFGYYDMFLINPQGQIVYTVFKETDFDSDLQNCPYRDSNLAGLIRQGLPPRKRDSPIWLTSPPMPPPMAPPPPSSPHRSTAVPGWWGCWPSRCPPTRSTTLRVKHSWWAAIR
jgi:hypothetical protein